MLQKSNTIWATYKLQRGSKYEEKLSNALKLVSKRHSIGSFANGFETHPKMTPFDKLVIQIIKETEIGKMKKDTEVMHTIILPYLSQPHASSGYWPSLLYSTMGSGGVLCALVASFRLHMPVHVYACCLFPLVLVLCAFLLINPKVIF